MMKSPMKLYIIVYLFSCVLFPFLEGKRSDAPTDYESFKKQILECDLSKDMQHLVDSLFALRQLVLESGKECPPLSKLLIEVSSNLPPTTQAEKEELLELMALFLEIERKEVKV